MGDRGPSRRLPEPAVRDPERPNFMTRAVSSRVRPLPPLVSRVRPRVTTSFPSQLPGAELLEDCRVPQLNHCTVAPSCGPFSPRRHQARHPYVEMPWSVGEAPWAGDRSPNLVWRLGGFSFGNGAWLRRPACLACSKRDALVGFMCIYSGAPYGNDPAFGRVPREPAGKAGMSHGKFFRAPATVRSAIAQVTRPIGAATNGLRRYLESRDSPGLSCRRFRPCPAKCLSHLFSTQRRL